MNQEEKALLCEELYKAAYGRWRIHVKWTNGRSTYPYSCGCDYVDTYTLQIR